MGYPTTIQLIARKKTEQWYVNFPAAIARGMDFQKGEIVEWTIGTRERITSGEVALVVACGLYGHGHLL